MQAFCAISTGQMADRDDTPLSRAETARRIKAGRMLRNVDQDELQRLLHLRGFDKYELGRLERGDLQLRAMQRRELAHVLHVPETWFVAAVDDIVGYEPLPSEREELFRKAEQVRLGREEIGWSQAELAERANVDLTTVVLLENAAVMPLPHELVRIDAQLLFTEPDEAESGQAAHEKGMGSS